MTDDHASAITDVPTMSILGPIWTDCAIQYGPIWTDPVIGCVYAGVMH
jgi:hypothetical protein